DFSRSVATLVNQGKLTADFPRRAFSPQASSIQTLDHVRRGEAHQRRRFLVEPDRARLSLLVATVADRDWLVGGSTSRMVQRILGRILPGHGNRGRLFHLGAQTTATAGLRSPRFSSARHRGDWQLLLLQSADDRALFVAD